MAADALRTDTAPARVIIFDHRAMDTCSFGLRERIAACFRLASHNGWLVEEVFGTDPDAGSTADELERALAICEHLGAKLLVYDESCVESVQLPGDRIRSVGLLTVRQQAAVS